MNGEPTKRELYDAILNLQGAMLHGFDKLGTRMNAFENRFDQIDRRFLDMDRRFLDMDRRFDRVDGRLESLEAASSH